MAKGVPQGAPTSCSTATLTLRPLERKQEGRLIIYADDVIYFPETSSEDPIKTLEDEEMGIKVNQNKSR
jgi:hypothetical protein